MARLPMTQLLGLSMITFSTLIFHVSIQYAWTRAHDAPQFEVAGFMVSILIGALGYVTFFWSLNSEVALRAATFAFVGANVGFGAMFALLERKTWTHWWVAAMVPVYVGMVAGVVMHDGDPAELPKRSKEDGKKGKRKDEREERGSNAEQREDFVKLIRSKDER